MKHLITALLIPLFVAKLSAQADTIPPTLHCKQAPIVANIQPTGSISFWADSTFFDTLYDNESSQIALGIRKVCIGAGFSTDTLITYYCVGEYEVECWARDEAGNTDSCRIHISIEDTGFSPICALPVMSSTEVTDGVEEVNYELRGYHCVYDSFLYTGSCCLPIPEPGSNFTLKPYKNNNPINGVTTYDLVLIAQHILGIRPLGSPYKMIAADVNYDGKISTLDIVLLRKFILGIDLDLPQRESWRFIPKDYVFPNPQDPFHPAFPTTIVVPFVTDPPQLEYNFIALKMGDVNNTAVANSRPAPKNGE